MSRPPSVREEIRQSRPFRSAGEEAAIALLVTAEAVRAALAVPIEAAGDLTIQQYNVLRILRGAHPEPLPTLEIAGRMIERTPGITRLLDRLERKGLVARDRGREDRRCVYCRITAPGLALLARLDTPVVTAADRLYAVLKKGEVRELTALLDRLRAAAHARSPEEKP